MSYSPNTRAPSLGPWLEDADALAALSSTDPVVRARLDYLISDVAGRAVDGKTVDMQTIQFEGHLDTSSDFLVLNKDVIEPDNVAVDARRALVGNAIACVIHGDPATVMLLPPVDRSMPIGNAAIITHELEHVTEREEDLLVGDSASAKQTSINSGLRERRAYGLNAATFRAIDGSDFDAYIGNWPFDLSSTMTDFVATANMHYLDDGRYAPPAETMMRAMWDEGPVSRQVLTCIGRISTLERQTGYLPEAIRNDMASGFNKVTQGNSSGN